MRRRLRPKDPALAQSSSIALTVALALLASGAAWVLLTDLLVYRLVDDPVVIGRLETAKGWIFVGLTGLVIYLTTNRAVRKLARSNATLQAVVASISDGVFLLDRDGAITFANAAAVRILGASKPEELLGMNGPEFARRFHVSLPNGHLLESQQFVSQRALTGECPPPYKAVLHPPGKPEVITIVTGAPVRPIPDGPVALAVSVMHDVTALEQLQRTRDTFVASAAHTLKTPVSIIKGQIDLLASGKSSSWKTSTEAIDRQCGRIARLTENLLVLARLRSESLQLRPEAVDLASVVIDASREMEASSPAHGLHWTLGAHPMVFADREQLGLVIRNLIEIAYRHSLPHTDIALTLEETQEHGRVCVAYQPVAPFDVLVQRDADAGFAGLGLERYVSAELVRASNATLGSDEVAEDRHEEWIQIPTIEELAHA